MSRFQTNSTTLHRCLIKWDRLKAHDRSFTTTSIRLALELQSFMGQMDDYFRFPDDHHHHAHHDQVIVVEETTNITTVESNDPDEAGTNHAATVASIDLNEAFVEIITAGPSNLRNTDRVPPDYPPTAANPQRPRQPVPATTTTTVRPNSANNPNADPDRPPHDRLHSHHPFQPNLGLRKQIVLKYKLNQLRLKTKKFNQRFEEHESKKSKLKLKGNQCIFNMVEDGKSLLELNESLIDLVFHLCLLRKKSNISK